MTTTEPRETQTPDGFKVQFGCVFSKSITGLFKCSEVTPDGFRGKSELESRIELDEMGTETIQVLMDTPVLTYSGKFNPRDCKLQ